MTSFFRKGGPRVASRITELEQIFEISTEDAEKKIYELGASHNACVAYGAATDKAFQAVEQNFEVVFEQTDALILESEDLKFALADERARTLTRNQKYFCDSFGTWVDALAPTFKAKQLREILVKFLNQTTKYHIDHVNEDIGTVERLVSLAVGQLVWACKKAFPSDDPNGPVWEAIRAHSLFEKVFPMRFRKEVKFGATGLSDFSSRVFLIPTKGQSLPSELGMPGYNLPYWAKQSGAESEKRLADLAEVLGVAILARSANEGFRSPDSQVTAARSLLGMVPDWLLKELFPAAKCEALVRWLADTRDLASATAVEPKSIEDRIDAIETLLGFKESSSQSDTDKLLAFADRLLRGLAEDDSVMSLAETTWREFWSLYCEILWDRGADEGIRVGLALSTEDVDYEIFKYERWKRLVLLRRIDSLLRAVGR
jgi:hypothetical protein